MAGHLLTGGVVGFFLTIYRPNDFEEVDDDLRRPSGERRVVNDPDRGNRERGRRQTFLEEVLRVFTKE